MAKRVLRPLRTFRNADSRRNSAHAVCRDASAAWPRPFRTATTIIGSPHCSVRLADGAILAIVDQASRMTCSSFVCRSRVLRRSRWSNRQGCHRISTSRSAVGYYFWRSVDRPGGDGSQRELGSSRRRHSAALILRTHISFPRLDLKSMTSSTRRSAAIYCGWQQSRKKYDPGQFLSRESQYQARPGAILMRCRRPKPARIGIRDSRTARGTRFSAQTPNDSRTLATTTPMASHSYISCTPCIPRQ
jgi:hypothetical protein